MNLDNNPILKIMAQDLCDLYQFKGWWPNATPETIAEALGPLYELQRCWLQSPLKADENMGTFPTDPKQGVLAFFTVGPTSYRYIYHRGEWMFSDAMPERLRRIEGAESYPTT